MIVVITDGESDARVYSVIQANYIKAAGIKIVCVGIVERSDEGYEELQQIATNPEEVVRLQVDDFTQLQTKVNTLVGVSCPPAPPPGSYIHPFLHLFRLIPIGLH